MSGFNYDDLDEQHKRLLDAFWELTDEEQEELIVYTKAVASGDRETADRMMTEARGARYEELGISG
jgi:hypothetical protein